MTVSPRPRSRTATLASFACVLLWLQPAPGFAHSPLGRTQEAAPAPRTQLQALLAKAAEYCQRLESSAFDFVCREEISESINPALDVAKKAPPANPGWTEYFGPTITVSKLRKIKHTFVYDYQCVRAGRAIREIRTQLEENGKRKVVPNAELRTSIVVFGTALLGPAGLFSERFQPDYDFTVSGQEKIGKTAVLVIEARPKPGAPPSRNLYGKAWINPATGDILKIEWSESRVASSAPSSAPRRTASASPAICRSRRPTSTTRAERPSARKRRSSTRISSSSPSRSKSATEPS
jgi:hypothetical protein